MKKGAMKVETFDRRTKQFIESYSVDATYEEAKIGWINREALQTDAYMVCDCVGDASDGKIGLLYLSKVSHEFFDRYFYSQDKVANYTTFMHLVNWGLGDANSEMDVEETFSYLKRNYDLSKIWAVQFSDVVIELFYANLNEVKQKYYELAFDYLTRDKVVNFVKEGEMYGLSAQAC